MLALEAPRAVQIVPDVEAAFWPHVDRGEGDPEADDRCWPWTHTCTREGRPRFACMGTQLFAERVAWELCGHGSTAGLRLVNQCGNTLCVRPSHYQSFLSGAGRPPKGVFMTKELAVPGYETPVQRPIAPSVAPATFVASEPRPSSVPAIAAKLPAPPELDPPHESPSVISSVIVGPEFAILHYQDGGVHVVHRHYDGKDLYATLASLAAKERGAA